jgi:general secretion pathway protein C
VAKLGLKPDDVVTSVNGIPLDSPARLPQLLENLKSASRVEATLQRDGKPTTVSVNLK